MEYSKLVRAASQSTQSQQEPQTATTQFADNRISSTTQLQIQGMMHASPQSIAQHKIQASMQPSLATQKQTIQCIEDEELLQGKFAAKPAEQLEEKPNNTGMPNQLKASIESLSGMSMDHVNVHYNSGKPAQLNAHAYAQGSDIHVAPGQERHLPHEAWHVVQQAQGRVKPTMEMKGNLSVNDDMDLEYEADLMGEKALTQSSVYLEQPPENSSVSSSRTETSSVLQPKVKFPGIPDTPADIGDISQAIIAKKEEFKKVIPEKEWSGEAAEAFEALFVKYAGPVYAALARMQRSEMDYGRFDLSDPHSLIALYYEIKKSNKDRHPEGDFTAKDEDLAAAKGVVKEADDIKKVKENLPRGAIFYKTALLGAGASVAYYLTANAASLDMANTVVIGNLQPWAGERGSEGRVNHPRHMISPDRNKAGPQADDAVLMSRMDFSRDIQASINAAEKGGATLVQKSIEKIKKVSVNASNVLAVTEAGIKLYQITLNDGSTYFAHDVIAGLGAGPMSEVDDRGNGGVSKSTLNDGLRAVGKLKSFNKVMNLNEFQQKATEIYTALQEEAADAIIFVSGGNAAIDAVTRIISENEKIVGEGKKLKLIWAQGSRGAPFLEGTDNEATREKYKGHLVDESSEFEGRTGNITVNGEKVEIAREGFDSYQADLYVHAQGSNTGKLKSYFDKTTILDKLTPTYDNNQEFGTEQLLPSVIGAEVAKVDENDKTSMKFIGATAESLLNDASAPAYSAIDHVKAHAQLLINSYNEIVGNLSYGFAAGRGLLDAIDLTLLVTEPVNDSIDGIMNSILNLPDNKETMLTFKDREISQKQLRESCLGVVRYLKAMIGLNSRLPKATPTSSIIFQKLTEVVGTLPINVLANAQLTPSRAQAEAEAGFVPPYVTKSIDFSIDSRTTIAVHIAATYQHLSEADANYWANRIVTARRPAHGKNIKGEPKLAENLVGPIPNPYERGRETTRSFQAAFTTLLERANKEAKSKGV